MKKGKEKQGLVYGKISTIVNNKYKVSILIPSYGTTIPIYTVYTYYLYNVFGVNFLERILN